MGHTYTKQLTDMLFYNCSVTRRICYLNMAGLLTYTSLQTFAFSKTFNGIMKAAP